MADGFSFRFFVKRFSKEIVSEAYVGILGREPDPGGLAAHAAVLARSGDLASLFSEMARSDEAWSRAQGEHAESTVRQLHDALRGGGAEIGASEWVGAPGSTFELGAVAAALATGPAHWRQLARHDPGVLIDAAYQALIGRQADEGGLATYTRLLRDGGDLVALLSSIGQSAEHQERVREALRAAGVDDEATLRAKAEAVVSQLHGALREGEPDAGELAGLVDHLEATADVGAIAASLAQGPGHWNKLVRHDPTLLIDAAYVALLGRKADEDGLATYARLLQNGGDLVALLSSIGMSGEHQERVREALRAAGVDDEATLRAKAEAVVSQLHGALREGEPDAGELAGLADHLEATADVGAIAASLAQGIEHWNKLIRHDPTALINAAYVALLDRAPDPDGLQAYTRFLQDSKDFTQLLAHIVRSPEHRERMLAEAGAVAPSTFVAAAYRGLLGREPDEAALAAQVERLQGYDLDPDQPRSARLASLLLELSRSDEAWSRARSEHAESIVLQLRDALRDDGVEQASLADWLAAPGSTLDIGAVAAAMGKGPAHWRKLVRTDPAVLINAAYVALLGREADEGGLATYARLLQDSGDPVALLSSIGQSAEHQERVREALRAAGVDDEATLRAKAEAVVSQLHGALREGEPDAGELAGLVDHLEATADVGAVAASLAQGIEHWNKLIRDDPTALIKAAYVALLDRAPDPEGLQVYTRFLQDSKDFARLLAHIVRSPEHREHVLAEAGAVAAPALVAAAYRGLLGRAPDDAVLAGDVERLRTTGDVTGFIAELSQSNEHRKRLLLRRN